MLWIATRAGLAALLLTGAAGCLGDEGRPSQTTESRPPTAADGFEMLDRRPRDLPHVDLHGRSIREHGVAGRCVEGPAGIAVNAIVLPHIPGVAALGPVGARERYGPVYAALPEGAPRIVYLAGLPTIGDSGWRLVRTLWISHPRYGGPVLVRGGRLDRAGTLGFGDDLPPRRSLRLPEGGWWGTDVGSREGGIRSTSRLARDSRSDPDSIAGLLRIPG